MKRERVESRRADTDGWIERKGTGVCVLSCLYLVGDLSRAWGLYRFVFHNAYYSTYVCSSPALA